MISEVYLRSEEANGSRAMARVDLLGEIERTADGSCRFRRGVREYAAIGDPAEMIGREELKLIYASSSARAITVGHLSQDPSIPAYVDTDHMLAKHFAVVGSTGVGKSSAVASILGKMIDVRPELRVLLLDVHNEYRAAFGSRANVIGGGEPAAAVLALQLRGDAQRHLRRQAGRARGGGDPRRADPDRQGEVPGRPRAARGRAGGRRGTAASPRTRPRPTTCRICWR